MPFGETSRWYAQWGHYRLCPGHTNGRQPAAKVHLPQNESVNLETDIDMELRFLPFQMTS